MAARSFSSGAIYRREASLTGTGSPIALAYYEPVLAHGRGNQDVFYSVGDSLVPDFMTTSEGDIMMMRGEV